MVLSKGKQINHDCHLGTYSAVVKWNGQAQAVCIRPAAETNSIDQSFQI